MQNKTSMVTPPSVQAQYDGRIIKTIPLSVVVTLVLAVGSTMWAASAEIHNYRLTNITTRLKTQETRILSMLDSESEKLRLQATRDADQDKAITINSTMLIDIKDTMNTISADVKTILRER